MSEPDSSASPVQSGAGSRETGAGSRLARLRRDPFAWMLVIGLALVTLSVPLFRREPPAPAPIGDMPAWAFRDAGGRLTESASLAGRTYLFVLVSSACEASCARVGRDLARMEDLFARVEADVTIVTLDVTAADPAATRQFLARSGATAGAWLGLTSHGAAPQAPCDLVRATFAKLRRVQVPCERLHDLADDPHALLVDGQARIRACIRLDREGLDETFHRALAIVENRPVETTP